MSFNTAAALATLNGLTVTFDMSVQEAEIFYPEICTIIPSKREGEDYGWISAVPGVREWIGDRMFDELAGATFHLKNKDWEDSIKIEKNKFDDDVVGLMTPAFKMLGQEAAQHPDELVFSAVTGGASALCYDGQYFYDTDHSQGKSGTQSNKLTYVAATGTVPTIDEFQGAFIQALVAMMGFKNDKGKLMHRPVLRKVSGLTVVVPLLMWQTAVKAIQAIIVNNTTNILISTPTVIASPYLTDSASFHTFKLDTPIKPFVFQARAPITRGIKGLNDMEVKDIKFMTQARYNVGYLAWWNAVLTTFT